jgi:hypothetical protein
MELTRGSARTSDRIREYPKCLRRKFNRFK